MSKEDLNMEVNELAVKEILDELTAPYQTVKGEQI